MDKQPAISVIVPVYNAEKYLHRCIDSILNQTFTNFEVLLINDGSTDTSGTICDEYAKKDSRVRVFHKENGGVSSARNVGIHNMLGVYSIHVDSDDWIDSSMFFLLYERAIKNRSDIVVCDYWKEYGNKKIHVECSKYYITGKEFFYDLLTYKADGACWNKLINNELYSKNNIIFPENINFGEDWFVNCIQAYYANNIDFIPKPLYHYIQNDNSIMHTLVNGDYYGRFETIVMLSKKLNLSLKEEPILAYLGYFIIECYNSGLFHPKELQNLCLNLNYDIMKCQLLPLTKRWTIKAIIKNNRFVLSLYQIMKKIKH